MIYSPPKNLDAKTFKATVATVMSEIKDLSKHLKNRSWIVGDSVTLADLACACVLTPLFQLVLDAQARKGIKEIAKWFESVTKLPQFLKSAGKIHMCATALKPLGLEEPAEAKADKPKGAKKETKKDADDDLDLFGDDDAEPAPKVKVEVKKKKKEVIAMSLVMLEVKPLDSDTVLDDLAKKCFTEIK